MFLDTTNKNIYGLWVGTSTGFNILEHLWFKGDGNTLFGHDLYTIRCYLTQEYIWFRNGDLNGF
jgi:hypothetical protein